MAKLRSIRCDRKKRGPFQDIAAVTLRMQCCLGCRRGKVVLPAVPREAEPNGRCSLRQETRSEEVLVEMELRRVASRDGYVGRRMRRRDDL